MKGCEKMYESYSRQALPDRKYREILGAALYVFNSNYDFLIENILHIKDKLQLKNDIDWWNLMNLEAGKLKRKLQQDSSFEPYREIFDHHPSLMGEFNHLKNRRNRIVHSFTAASDHDSHKQVLYSLDPKTKEQEEITEAYLLEFIKENEVFALRLDEFRNEILNNV